MAGTSIGELLPPDILAWASPKGVKAGEGAPGADALDSHADASRPLRVAIGGNQINSLALRPTAWEQGEAGRASLSTMPLPRLSTELFVFQSTQKSTVFAGGRLGCSPVMSGGSVYDCATLA